MKPTLLNNRYKFIRGLGAGGFGETFLVEDTQTPSGRCCVIKQLKPVGGNSQVHQLVQERFKREAAILEELGDGSNQIPYLYASFVEDEQFYLVQEWIQGQTLRNKLEQEGLFSESSVKQILLNLLPVLEYVHSKHIVHRDIKPENIILRFSDGKPVLIDFGAVKETVRTVMTVSGHSSRSIVIGTPGFMPNEQSAGRPVYSSDLYSLGLTAIYLLTGRIPQQLKTNLQTGEILWRHYALGVSPSFASLLDRAIQPSSCDRYSTAQEMLRALQPATTPIPLNTFSSQPTEVLVPSIGVSYQPQGVVSPQAAARSNSLRDWQRAVIASSVIGACVVVGLFATRQQAPSSQPSLQPSIMPQGSSTAPVAPSTQHGSSAMAPGAPPFIHPQVPSNLLPATQVPNQTQDSQQPSSSSQQSGNTARKGTSIPMSFESVDQRLNQVYQELMSRQIGEDRTKLVSAELSWIKFRDSHCYFQTSAYGSSKTDCLAEVTQQRTGQLENALSPPTNKSGTQRAYDAADSELNQIYQELMLKQTNANRQKLIRAELAWINFRDTNCAFQTSVYGGSTADCLTEVTQQRT